MGTAPWPAQPDGARTARITYAFCLGGPLFVLPVMVRGVFGAPGAAAFDEAVRAEFGGIPFMGVDQHRGDGKTVWVDLPVPDTATVQFPCAHPAAPLA